MPWQDLLSPAQRVQVLALPTSLREYEELYTLTPADLEFVAAHRTDANRLGVATQLCFLRHPGRAWTPAEIMPAAMLRFIALQVEPRGRRHRSLEHGLSGAGGRRDPPERPSRVRRDPRPPFTPQVGAHQPDRRLPLA